jgi:hypothetical protein
MNEHLFLYTYKQSADLKVYNSNCVFFSTVIPVTFIYVFSISLYLRPKGVIIYLGHI